MKKHAFLLFNILIICLPSAAQIQAWEHIPGPDGGGIENFDTDGHTLYCLTPAGIYRSYDEGYHWQIAVPSLATTRNKSQLQVEEGVFYAFDAQGALVRSTDDGANWETLLQQPFPIPHEEERLQVLFTKGDTVLVGSTFTIYRSTDRGRTWKTTIQLKNELHAEFTSIIEFKNELFAAEGAYVHRSSDGGLTWETVLHLDINGYWNVAATDSFILALYDWKLVRSKDGFRTWQELPAENLRNDYLSTFNWLFGWGNELFIFFKYAIPCSLHYYYSPDGGITWELKKSESTEKILTPEMRAGVLFGQHIIASGDGVFHSVDGARTFQLGQKGLPVSSIQNIISVEESLVTSSSSAASISDDGGKTWLENIRPLPNWMCDRGFQFARTQEKLVRYAYNNYNDMEYSTDKGHTWTTKYISRFKTLAFTGHALWLMYDKSIGSQLPPNYEFWKMADGDTSFISQPLVGYQPKDKITGFRGFGDLLFVHDSAGYHVFDDQLRFIRSVPKSPCETIFPRQFYFDGTAYYAFCDTRAYVLRADAPQWQEIYPQDWTTGIPFYHSKMNLLTSHQGILWVGLEGKGLFYATDQTGRFYPVQPQLPYPYPTSIAFDEQNMWVSTDGGGVFRLPLPQSQIDAMPALKFMVFPNPSTGLLHLESDVFFKEKITLHVLDATGRLLANQTLRPGRYWEIELDAIPPGFYMLQLHTSLGVSGVKWVRMD